jgi:hypothetical protein
MPSPDGEVPSQCGSLPLGGPDFGNSSFGGGDMEEIGRQCIFRYFHPAYERTLGFHVRFQPKKRSWGWKCVYLIVIKSLDLQLLWIGDEFQLSKRLRDKYYNIQISSLRIRDNYYDLLLLGTTIYEFSGFCSFKCLFPYSFAWVTIKSQMCVPYLTLGLVFVIN